MPVKPPLLALAEPIEAENGWPRPTCPACASGHIRFEEPNRSESLASERGHPGFDPEWIRGTFSVLAECENPECRQALHGTGDYWVADAKQTYREDEFANEYVVYANYYRIAHLHPPLLLMPIPEAAPDTVKEGILRASRVLFADPGLAATALRSTIERFMTSEGVGATSPTASGGTRFRSAHERIEEWAKGNPDREGIASLLEAVKWLGNAGTHEDSDVTLSEVLWGASALDETFHRLYIGPDLDAQALTINSAKGPVREP